MRLIELPSGKIINLGTVTYCVDDSGTSLGDYLRVHFNVSYNPPEVNGLEVDWIGLSGDDIKAFRSLAEKILP